MLPKRLKSGDTIAFYSPSATYSAPKRFKRAEDFLRTRVQTHPGKLTGKSDFYRSGSIGQRDQGVGNKKGATMPSL